MPTHILPAAPRRITFLPRTICFALLTAGALLTPLGAQVAYTDAQDNATPLSTTTGSPLTLTIASGTATQSGAISGDGSITKTGAGTLGLTGGNNYSGGTVITEGVLAINNTSRVGSGTVAISSGATLDLGSLNLGLAGSLAMRISGPGTVTTTGAFNNGSAANFTHSFALGGTATLNHTGTGSLTLTGASTHTGATTVSNGTLIIAGSIANSVITVNSSGRLAGSGAVNTLILAGTLSPGNSPGTLNAGNTTWQGGANYVWEINNAANPQSLGAAGTNYDLLAISGTLSIAATSENKFTLSLVSLLANNTAGDVLNFNSAVNSSYTIASASGGIIGFDANAFTINASGFTNALNGGSWNLSQVGNNLNLNFAAAASAIPEPSTYAAIFGALAIGLAAYRRRRV